MSNVAELLLPAIRWDSERGYADARPMIDRALELGVGGFVLIGGPENEVRALTKELRQRSRIPLLIGAELERGAGQQFAGTTGFPPLAAIATLDDPNAISRAAKHTAREARTIGVNWGFAPVCDLDVSANDPLTAFRSIGREPVKVGAIASAWIQACQHEGVLACAKHFPGRGRASEDGVGGMLSVPYPRGLLLDNDLVPFRASISARVASIMAVHASFPSFDASAAPATFSTQMLRYLLREKLGFEGLVVTDVLTNAEALGLVREEDLAIRALDAGCDLLLCPTELEEIVAALDQSVRDGPLYEDRIDQSRRRRLKWAQWAAPPTDYRRVSESDLVWARQLTERVVQVVRGSPVRFESPVEVVVVDDTDQALSAGDCGSSFLTALRAGGVLARPIDVPTASCGTALVVLLFGGAHVKDGRLGYSERSLARVAATCSSAQAAGRQAAVVQFGPPRLGGQIRGGDVLLSTWSGDRCMQQAAARTLLRGEAR